MGLLDLSGADTKGFEALDAGAYEAEVFNVENKATKGGENAKMPEGTPMLNVQFRILGRKGETIGEDSEVYNRRVFNSFVIAPEKIGGKKYEHKAMMDGQLVRFFKSIGYDEAEVMSGSFDPDFEDMKGRSCTLTVSKEEYPKGSGEYQNRVKGIKPSDGSDGSGIL